MNIERTEFINLNYFFRADLNDYQLIIKRGFFENHKTNSDYGKAIYLTDDKNINLNNKNIILNVDLNDIENILYVPTYDFFLQNYIPDLYKKFLNVGRTTQIGNKIQNFLINNNFNGIKIKNENLLVLYNNKNIRFIRLFDENLKTLRNFSSVSLSNFILYGDDTNPNNVNYPIKDNDDNKLLHGNF